jgi:hypothetical protein
MTCVFKVSKIRVLSQKRNTTLQGVLHTALHAALHAFSILFSLSAFFLTSVLKTACS